ncbi:MAG: hypothetical protein ABIT69_03945 [Sphingomicrobium sp.]
MTPFEFVFFLYALMLSLALTHLVGGWAMALRHASAIKWSLPHLMWAVSALFLTIGNLASFWQMRDASTWTSWLVLSNFAFALLNYVFCVFITPEVDTGAVLDLEAFHADERRRYLAPLVLLEIVAIFSNVANGLYAGYDHWQSDLVVSAAELSVTLVAILSARNWVQLGAGAATLAMSSWFVIAASSIIGT